MNKALVFRNSFPVRQDVVAKRWDITAVYLSSGALVLVAIAVAVQLLRVKRPSSAVGMPRDEA